jgi:RHS repeat-associated protein
LPRRIDLSPAGPGEPLYDMSARFYAPSLGVFTQLDTVIGSAQDPLSMNRFLYAAANPATLIDPTGHFFEGFDPLGFVGQTAQNVGAFGVGVVEGAVGSVVEGGAALVTMAGQAGGCAIDSSCRAAAAASVDRAAREFAADPGKAVSRAAEAVVEGGKAAVASTVDRVGTAIRTGNYRELGKITGEIGVNFVPVGAIASKAGAIARAATAARGTSGLTSASRVVNLAERLVQRARGAGRACAHSFSADTPVATAEGSVPIAEIEVGDEVLAAEPETARVSERTVTATHEHLDPVVGVVVIDGESIETTPEHRFYTVESGWVEAGDLRVGEHVRSASGSEGVVGSLTWQSTPATMYDLTVEVDHSFFVGEGQWLVHNCAAPARGANNPATALASRIGQEAHRQIEAEEVLIRRARPEVGLDLPISGRTVRKDLRYPDGSYGIIKPLTTSGVKAAIRRQRLLVAEGFRARIINYNPNLRRWLPGSPTYIGPKKAL